MLVRVLRSEAGRIKAKNGGRDGSQNAPQSRVHAIGATFSRPIDQFREIEKRGALFLHFRLFESLPLCESERDFLEEKPGAWKLRRLRVRQSARL